MKNLILISMLISGLFSFAAAYKFLGPKWPGAAPEVTYLINEEGTADVVNEFEAIQRSFQVWEEARGTAVTTKYLGTTNSRSVAPNHQNVVKWEDGNRFDFDQNVIAVCYYWYEGANLTDFDIVFNGRDFSWSTTGESRKMDVGHIATHEVGHALGLGHSDVSGSVMWPTAAWGDTSHRNLTSDDSLGIVRLYPRTTTNNHLPKITSLPKTEAISGEKYEYQVIASDEDGDSLKYRLVTFPLNMRIDSLTGLIVWYPKFLDLGAHAVTVEVKDSFGGIARQSFSVKVGDLVVYTPDTTIDFGDTLYYNVYVTNMEGWGIFAGNIELGYDLNKVTILEVDTVGSVIAGTTYAKNITSEMIKFAFAGSEPYNGAGSLFRIKMLVNKEKCGEKLSLNLSKAFFNDGTPVATPKNGSIFMKCGPCGGSYSYNIDGKVIYESNRMGVSGVNMVLTGFDKRATSNQEGFYEFVAVPRSSLSYSITASKDSGDVRNAISAYDASLILRNVVGIIGLNTFAHQALCADVNSNNMITAYDAALILRYVVKYNDGTSIGKWVVLPPSLTLPNLLESKHGADFTSYMIGDVSGNWNDFNSEMPKANFDAAACVTLTSTQDTLSTKDSVEYEATMLQIAYRNVSGVYSGEFEISFDAENFSVAGIKTAASLNGFTCASHVVGDRILVAFAGTLPMTSQGELFSVALAPKTPGYSLFEPEMQFARFNEMKNGLIRVERKTQAAGSVSATAIQSVYPNPFNPSVSIEYTVNQAQKISMGIYDLAGREVVKLAHGVVDAGFYKAIWNGKNSQGRSMATGIYLLLFESGALVKTTRLYLVK